MSFLSKAFGLDDGKTVTYSSEERKITAASLRIGWTVVAFGLLGVFLIVLWAFGVVCNLPKSTPSLGWSGFVGADLLVAAAAGAAGALLGFVFAIPRTLDPASRAVVAGAASQSPAAASHAAMTANTNLERISDWLTTLLIGATLVQIKDIAKWVGELGKNLIVVSSLANDAIVPIIVIYYFALAFLGIYLITRLYLTSAFMQTLGILIGGGQPGDLQNPLKKVLDDASQLSKASDLRAALTTYDNWPLSREERDDPDLNAKLARVLCKAIQTGATASRKGDASVELKGVLAKAATEDTIKTQLKTDAAAGKLATGNDALDTEVAKILA